jgi:import inner membrane translocase subunit TIM44
MSRAGESLVLSDKQQSTESTRFAFIKNSPAYQRWLETYEESDSPFISALRTITTKVGGLFEENETAQVIRAMKEIDPDFRLERWTGELREYIVPEVVDAYLSADRESLRQWCGEAVCLVFGPKSLYSYLDLQRAMGNNGSIHQARPNLRFEDLGYQTC